jgi:hypothetical protein
MGSHTRKWLILATIVQALLLMASALTAHYGKYVLNAIFVIGNAEPILLVIQADFQGSLRRSKCSELGPWIGRS